MATLARLVNASSVVLLGALLAACAAAPQRQPLPQELADRAEVPGIPAARHWGDEAPDAFRDWLRLPDAELQALYPALVGRPHRYLLISGGGGDGAFGAGLLVGWTVAGNRPEFQMVTGISTGAIIAPFAFLGPAYDETLRELYTSFSSDDLVRKRNLVQVLRGDSAFDTTPMVDLLDRYLGDAQIAAIAAEGRRGRSLLIGTTNLDAGRPVIWDVTRIAMSGAPHARQLIHDIIRASSAIPGAFPPVMLQVQVEGKRYDELHVDGGVTSQVFLGATGLDWRRIAERLRVEGAPRLYVIRNARTAPQWESVERRLAPIMARSIASLIRDQGIGDMARIYLVADRFGMEFNLARVPEDFAVEAVELFDRNYMQALFERGFVAGKQGDIWIRENR
jgi:hypothetical protein